MRQCEVNGTTYEVRSEPDGDNPCEGCVGEESGRMCRSLPFCDGVIFVKVESEGPDHG